MCIPQEISIFFYFLSGSFPKNPNKTHATTNHSNSHLQTEQRLQNRSDRSFF